MNWAQKEGKLIRKGKTVEREAIRTNKGKGGKDEGKNLSKGSLEK